MINGSYDEKELKKIKKLLALYNMIPNLVWSFINLIPISVFCYRQIDRQTLYIFMAISIFPVFLTKTFLNKIQLSRTTALYKKLGIQVINIVAQNGFIINSLIKKRYPAYKAVSNRKDSISRLISQTYMFEKFHLILFVFFSLIMFFAITRNYWYWVVIIFLTNIAYNVYPNLLQQYIRLKLLQYRNISKAKPA